MARSLKKGPFVDEHLMKKVERQITSCLLYTSPSPRD